MTQICCAVSTVELQLDRFALRAESDIKLSASACATLYDYDSGPLLFIQGTIGVSGSGAYLGWAIPFSDSREYEIVELRPKIGFLRTYNSPWNVENNETYFYYGMELSFLQGPAGMNLHAGILNGSEDSYASAGIGLAF